MIRRPPRSTLFPSTTLSRSALRARVLSDAPGRLLQRATDDVHADLLVPIGLHPVHRLDRLDQRNAAARHDSLFHRRASGREDRKSTRLNSSHLVISYAVFCL